jgi:hypothetical protein
MTTPTSANASHPPAGNTELARLLAATGYSERRRAFARLVNARAEDYATEFDYDHTTVKRWLAGAVPSPPVPDAIADTLTDLLGYSITPADLGWPAGSADDRGLLVEVDPSRTLRAVAGLTGRRTNRRDLLWGAAAVGAVASPGSRTRGGLRSMRVADHIRGLQQGLVRWRDRVAVREFGQRADAILPAAA